MKKFALFCCCFFIGIAAANTEIIKVEVEGYGENLQSAIDRALTEAMGRVNGRSIESEILSKNRETLNYNKYKMLIIDHFLNKMFLFIARS